MVNNSGPRDTHQMRHDNLILGFICHLAGRKCVLSRLFTSLPKCNYWNTRRKKQSSVLKTDGNWHSGMPKLEFQRTQNPTLHSPIPIWGLDARVAAYQRIWLDWDLATRLENRESVVFGRRNGGIEERW
ncbi:hypothetical protein AVEN_138449-1 [Araneus ventricosus]|uniref:Uncharacterized protein n=1 Tax=Araneus ventricosus TaxID=182803 RepID=A0A4Y2CDL1_ARAVE|nr:hypothetical protein AVEN_138449-1 [Araneus ventricosus]